MEMLDALSQSFDHAAKVMGGVGPDQLDAPTPCRAWDVRTLAAHILGVLTNMDRGARGEALLPNLDAVPLEADLGDQFRALSDRTLEAWTARGSDGLVDIGAGPMPVTAALGINLLDTSTHAWDLARATGQQADLPDDLATTVLAVGHGVVTDDLRQFAGFDPAIAVGPDASPTDRLVAFLGRQP